MAAASTIASTVTSSSLRHPTASRSVALDARRGRRTVGAVDDDAVAPADHGGPRAPGRLEDDQFVGTEPERRPTGQTAGELRRQLVADHVDRIGLVVKPQRKAQVGVRPDVVVDHAGGTLRREQHVHAEAATALGDTDQRLQEVGELLRKRCELVDHDHESSNRFAVSSRSSLGGSGSR